MEGLKWKDLYESVQLEVEIFQTAAILEVGLKKFFLLFL